MRRTHLLCFAMVVMLASPAVADSIDPTGITWNIAPSTSETVLDTFTKTITVDSQQSGDIDFVFLFDASASMGDLLDTTTLGVATQLIADLDTAFGGSATLRYGVAYYQDFTSVGGEVRFGTDTEVPWSIVTPLGGDAATGLSTLASLATNGHPSDPESGIYALYKAATDPGVGWDPNPLTKRILVWVGDAPSWDAALQPDVPFGISLNDAVSALQGSNIIVEALSVGLLGLDGAAGPIDWTPAYPVQFVAGGQASYIATMTGGSVTDLTGTPLASITSDQLLDSILDAIELTINEYGEVSLDVSAAEALGLTVDFTPGSYVGTYDRSITRTFAFDVTITVPGSPDGTVYFFPIYGTLNGNRIVAEWDEIIVGTRQVPDVPEPSTIALMGLGLLGLGVAARRKLRK